MNLNRLRATLAMTAALIVTATVFVATGAPVHAASATIGAADVSGDWLTASRDAVVRIAPCGPHACGTVIRVLARGPNVPHTDVKNPDPAARSQPLVGLTVLSGFAPSASGWVGGRAYDPASGRTYKASLALNADRTLGVKGCVLFICQSQRWTRAR
jgi:uncharacterized protein (DUF2147 family)